MGRVKKIPIHSAMMPSIEQIIKMIISRRIIQNFFETVVMLAFMALIPSRFPKIMKGIVKSVNIGTSTETKKEMTARPKVRMASEKYRLLSWINVPIPDEVKVITAAERNRSLKCLVL